MAPLFTNSRAPYPAFADTYPTQRSRQSHGHPFFRIEHDLLGDREVPADVYYGVHSLRARKNFAITGTAISIYPELIKALACIKQAAALSNHELGLLDE